MADLLSLVMSFATGRFHIQFELLPSYVTAAENSYQISQLWSDCRSLGVALAVAGVY